MLFCNASICAYLSTICTLVGSVRIFSCQVVLQILSDKTFEYVIVFFCGVMMMMMIFYCRHLLLSRLQFVYLFFSINISISEFCGFYS